MTYNHKKGAEDAIHVIRNKLREYTFIKPFEDKTTTSDKFWGLGDITNTRMAKDTRQGNYKAKMANVDADVITWLSELSTRITKAQKEDPEFYSKAKDYVDPLLKLAGAIHKSDIMVIRTALGLKINGILESLEKDSGLKPKGDVADLNERLLGAKEETIYAKGAPKREAYEAYLKQVKAYAKEAGISEEDAVKQFKEQYDQLKDFVTSYNSDRKKDAYADFIGKIKEAAKAEGVSEEEAVKRIELSTNELGKFLSVYGKDKKAKK